MRGLQGFEIRAPPRRNSSPNLSLVMESIMNKTSRVFATLLCASMTGFILNAQAATSKLAADDSDEQPPALAVGALQVSTDAPLTVTAMSIEVTADKIAYSYGFKNERSTAIDMLGTVTMPTLDASGQDDAPQLPRLDAGNPVGLKVATSAGPIATKAHAKAWALEMNRQAELAAANIPLLPFGSETIKALQDAPADVIAKLKRLGLIAPRDPAKPTEAYEPAWSLDVTRELDISLPANAETRVNLAFSPIRSDYELAQENDDDLDELKGEYCLSPSTLARLRARMKSGAGWQVSELAVDVSAPSTAFSAPAATLSVRKPSENAIVAFCGADEKTLGAETVAGLAPDDIEDGELHILIFSPADR
ncbi:DUF4424 family protein [Methylocystis bryophila]|uniref:DUF4424 domain-containing protein n=1 Tax=Methylocystis bryophila TaxID=655015 RepID=A0A1W6MRI6_9HYPH|nr:DUF4424 family protein [Methylocystis bryophila]ARN80182.1 hypothetical protein B1812_02755 [Methylocystis bryophila]BDV40128.1 hypothetical protein DSM21852_33810 [Methylocystis bryophila]